MAKKFVKDWYKVENRHATSIAMQALQHLSGNLNLFGLYMYLYDVTVKTEGEISKDDFELTCQIKANLNDEGIQAFVDCCLKRGVLVQSEDGERFYLPEVQEYLENLAEVERKKFADCSKGGKISAENRAKAYNLANDTDTQNTMQYVNASHDIPYGCGQSKGW